MARSPAIVRSSSLMKIAMNSHTWPLDDKIACEKCGRRLPPKALDWRDDRLLCYGCREPDDWTVR